MKLTDLLFIPFIFQGIAIFIDEFYFHYRRDLPRWERLGHPIDTLSVLFCYLFILTNGYSERNLVIYIGLCLLSSFLVTKDEFVHTGLCTASENWIHSILFILHSIIFLITGFFWAHGFYMLFLKIQTALIFVFMFYQISYWQIFYEKHK